MVAKPVFETGFETVLKPVFKISIRIKSNSILINAFALKR
jgi:hypothetical protein